MKILSIERARPNHGCIKDLAKFSVEINEDLRLANMRLVENPSGRRLVYAQSAGGSRCATFSAELAKTLTALASEFFDKMVDRQVDEHRTAA